MCVCVSLCEFARVFFVAENSKAPFAMNWTHPGMLLLYAVLALMLFSFVANRAKKTYSAPKASKYCISQAKSAVWGASQNKPSLQLMQRLCALIFLKSARKMSPDDEILHQSGIDPVALKQELLPSTTLLQSVNITDDEFRQLIA
jgi:hypothetical protein